MNKALKSAFEKFLEELMKAVGGGEEAEEEEVLPKRKKKVVEEEDEEEEVVKKKKKVVVDDDEDDANNEVKVALVKLAKKKGKQVALAILEKLDVEKSEELDEAGCKRAMKLIAKAMAVEDEEDDD